VRTQTRRALGLDAAQALLGHKNLNMTEQYAKLNVEDVVEVRPGSGEPWGLDRAVPRGPLARRGPPHQLRRESRTAQTRRPRGQLA
jgi:hypothetical protein